MGACASKSNSKPSCLSAKRHLPSTRSPYLYSLRSKTNTLLRYDTQYGTLKEREIIGMPEFQEGQLCCLCSPGEVMCVGGVEDGSTAMIVNETQLTWRKLDPPTYPLAYGQMHHINSRVFIFGALYLTPENQNGDPCPPLLFSLHSEKWTTLPPPPVPLALYGSAVSQNRIIAFGGFLDHPNYSLPCDAVFVLTLDNWQWTRLPFRSPLAISLPRCVFVDNSAVLIIGGHDPLDRFPESKSVFMFNSGDFRVLEDLPEIGKLRFCDTPIMVNDVAYLFSEDETMFKYYTISNFWEYVDLTTLNMKESAPTARPSFMQVGESVYRYERKTGEFLEYSVTAKKARRLNPSVFRVFAKWPGLMVTGEGEVMVAGGLKIVKGDLEEDIDSVWLFNSVTRSISDLTPLTEKQHGLRLLEVTGKIYAISGVCKQFTPWKSFCQVSASIDSPWEMLPPMPYPTSFPGVGLFLNNIYCLAGESQTDYCSQFNLVQVFSIKENEWKVLTTEYPLGLQHLGVCSLELGLLCFGGKFEDKSSSNKAFLIDESLQFHAVADFPRVRGYKGSVQSPVIKWGQNVYAFIKGGPLLEYQAEFDQWEVIEV